MSAIHHKRLKLIEFALGVEQFECQVRSWQLVNNTPDGDKVYTFCPDGEDVEETDPGYALELSFFSDWRSGGISDYLWDNDGSTVAFTLNHHPGVTGEHVQWTGEVRIKAPSVGGEARATEVTEVTLQCIGKPEYTRP
ncbi:MAG TPA: hypothetical protein VGD67_13775 [Pseudonocardiaceae bacterium]